VGIWADTYFSGSYSQAIDLTLLNPATGSDRRDCPDRQGRTKYGYYLNFEQAVSDDVGVFGRWSWNNGKNEIAAFTDIDASLSWVLRSRARAGDGRISDRSCWGHQQPFERSPRLYRGGRPRHLDRDGRLNYHPRQFSKPSTAMNVGKGATLTFDYQFLANPAHNADRGPISVFSGRVHGSSERQQHAPEGGGCCSWNGGSTAG
jgi:high affinity Mn2+ porin